MKRKTTILGGGGLIDGCASSIHDKYKAKHYDVQRSISTTQDSVSILVTITASTSKFGRFLRGVTGLYSRASLKLTPDGENLTVLVSGGMWWDKIFVALVGVFFYPLFIFLILGMVNQRKLHNQVYQDTLQWFNARKAWLGGRVVKIRTTKHAPNGQGLD